MVDESITAAIDIFKFMELKESTGKNAQVALSKRVAKFEKATQDLLQNLTIVQHNMAASISCRDSD